MFLIGPGLRHVLRSRCYLGRSRKYSLAWGSSSLDGLESSQPGPHLGLHSAVLEVKGGLSQLPAALLSLQLRTLLRNLQPKPNPFISCPGQVVCHSNRGKGSTRGTAEVHYSKACSTQNQMAAPTPVSTSFVKFFLYTKAVIYQPMNKTSLLLRTKQVMFFSGHFPVFPRT